MQVNLFFAPGSYSSKDVEILKQLISLCRQQGKPVDNPQEVKSSHQNKNLQENLEAQNSESRSQKDSEEDQSIKKQKKRSRINSENRKQKRRKVEDELCEIVDSEISFKEPAVLGYRTETRNKCIFPYTSIGFSGSFEKKCQSHCSEGFWLIRRTVNQRYNNFANVTEFISKKEDHIIFEINRFWVTEIDKSGNRGKKAFFSAHRNGDTIYDLWEFSEGKQFIHGSLNVAHRGTYSKIMGEL